VRRGILVVIDPDQASLQAAIRAGFRPVADERDPTLKCDEVQYLIDFIRTSSRGVGLRRPSRRLEEVADE